MRKIKRIAAALTLIGSMLACSVPAYATEGMVPMSEYEAILEHFNEEYGVDLIFIEVDRELVTLEHYRTVVRQQAQAERVTQDALKGVPNIPVNGNGINLLGYEYTKNIDVDTGEGTRINSTYTVYDGNTVSQPSRSSLYMTSEAQSAGGALNAISRPAYYLSSDRTYGRITFTANLTVLHVSVGGRTFVAYYSPSGGWRE